MNIMDLRKLFQRKETMIGLALIIAVSLVFIGRSLDITEYRGESRDPSVSFDSIKDITAQYSTQYEEEDDIVNQDFRNYVIDHTFSFGDPDGDLKDYTITYTDRYGDSEVFMTDKITTFPTYSEKVTITIIERTRESLSPYTITIKLKGECSDGGGRTDSVEVTIDIFLSQEPTPEYKSEMEANARPDRAPFPDFLDDVPTFELPLILLSISIIYIFKRRNNNEYD